MTNVLIYSANEIFNDPTVKKSITTFFNDISSDVKSVGIDHRPIQIHINDHQTY